MNRKSNRNHKSTRHPDFMYQHPNMGKKKNTKKAKADRRKMQREPETIFHDYRYVHIGDEGDIEIDGQPCHAKFWTPRPYAWTLASYKYFNTRKKHVTLRVLNEGFQFCISHETPDADESIWEPENWDITIAIWKTGTVLVQGAKWEVFEQKHFQQIKSVLVASDTDAISSEVNQLFINRTVIKLGKHDKTLTEDSILVMACSPKEVADNVQSQVTAPQQLDSVNMSDTVMDNVNMSDTVMDNVNTSDTIMEGAKAHSKHNISSTMIQEEKGNSEYNVFKKLQSSFRQIFGRGNKTNDSLLNSSQEILVPNTQNSLSDEPQIQRQ